MSFEMWVTRERWFGPDDRLKSFFKFYLRKKDVKRLVIEGTGITFFLGADFSVCEGEGERILKKEGLALDYGEGPVKVEVAIRRAE